MQPLYPKDSLTIADRLSEELIKAIVKGQIPSGSKINEPELARAYQISRGPLREAIRRLEGLRLVVRIPHVGARVVSLGAEELLEIYHVREALEGMAARLAAVHMSQAEISALYRLLNLHEADIKQSGRCDYFQEGGDLDIHYRIIQGSRNARLMELLCGELYHLIRMYRYRCSQSPERPQAALHEHRHILAAIEQRDGEFAEMLMRRHISTARQVIEKNHHAMLSQTEATA